MASLQERKKSNGKSAWLIQFLLGGQRRSLYLSSKYPRDYAREIAGVVEKLVDCIAIDTEPDRRTMAWLTEISDDLRQRFVAAGLIVVPETVTLWDIWERFLDESTGRKDSTLTGYRVSQKRFFGFFLKDAEADSVTSQDAADYKEHLLGDLAPPTVAGTISRAKSVFGWAVKRGLAARDPFADVKRGSYKNKKREFFVPMEWYGKLIDACPDQTWRTIVALCRIGGLRCTSEVLAMRWEDVDWDNGRMQVRSVKTERLAGHESRIIPLWPELREQLNAQWDQAEEGGSPYVIAKYRGASSVLRTYFEKVVFRAGLQRWPRLFHNLRGSRSNELFSRFPGHVASYWMGQSETIARAHYLHATDQDYETALQMDGDHGKGNRLRKNELVAPEVASPEFSVGCDGQSYSAERSGKHDKTQKNQ